MYYKVQLGTSAASYVRLVLENRECLWHALSDLDFESGSVFTYLPFEPTRQELLHLSWPLLSRESLESGTVDWEFRNMNHNFVLKFLEQHEQGVAIFREMTIPPLRKFEADPRAINFFRHRLDHTKRIDPSPVFSTEIYYFLRAQGVSLERVKLYMSATPIRPFVGVLAKASAELTPDVSGQEVSSEIFDNITNTITKTTEHVLVSAFDEDALLIWSKSIAG
jgi:hypothetical protein